MIRLGGKKYTTFSLNVIFKCEDKIWGRAGGRGGTTTTTTADIIVLMSVGRLESLSLLDFSARVFSMTQDLPAEFAFCKVIQSLLTPFSSFCRPLYPSFYLSLNKASESGRQ